MVLTSTPPRTLVVNPAFLQEIKDCNPDLWQTVDQLRQVCAVDDEPSKILRRLTRLLDSLRDQLALQFSLEESYGYIEVAGESSRILSELAGQIQSQHGMLYLQLSDLAEQAEELQYRGVEKSQLESLLERTRHFDADLSQHEQAETQLIERSIGLS